MAVAAGLLVGCTSPPALQPPDHLESFCGGRPAPPETILSIVTSVADRIETTIAAPSAAVLRVDVAQNGGAIGHWTAPQPLYMPGTAHALGLSGNYIDVTDVVIDNQLAGSQSRLLYVTVATASGPKPLVLRAFDTQNVCTLPSPAPT